MRYILRRVENAMAAPALKDTPLVDDAKPEVALGNVIDAISKFGDRAAVMRRLEAEDAASKARFEEQAKAEWDALKVLRETYLAQPPEKRDIAALDAAIDKRAALSDMKRAVHDAILNMVRRLVPDVAKATGQPEEWVRRALAYVTYPAQRDAQHSIDLHFEMEALASEVDPDNSLSGDVLKPGDDVEAWFKRMMAES